MAFGRGHASFTIDTLKLAKDSLPAAVTEPPPVYPVCIIIKYYEKRSILYIFSIILKELVNTPHPLIENPVNDYDYKLKLKLNFNSSFRTLHDPTKDDHEKNFILNKWKEGRRKCFFFSIFKKQKSFRMVTFTSRIKTSISNKYKFIKN